MSKGSSPEQIKKYNATYYIKNKEKITPKLKKYRETHKKQIKESKILHNYNLTSEQYTQIFIDQDNKCKICLDQISRENASVDHIHGTKIVRGLLCSSCNLGIGKLKDNFNILERAYVYVRDQGNI